MATIDGSIVSADLAVTQKTDLPLDGVGRVAHAEAQGQLPLRVSQCCFARTLLAMLLTTKTCAKQIRIVQLSRWVRPALALPMLDLHPSGVGPNAGLAVAAQAALLSHQLYLTASLVSVGVIVVSRCMRLLTMLGHWDRGSRPF